MAHRDKSLTGYITNETHGELAITTSLIVKTLTDRGDDWYVFLSPTLYDAAESMGADMRLYIRQETMPLHACMPAWDGVYKIDHSVPSSEEMRAAVKARLNAGGLPLGANHVHDNIPVMLSPGEYSINGGRTWFAGNALDAMKRMRRNRREPK